MVKAIIFDFDGVIHNTLEVAFEAQSKTLPGITMEEYKSFFDGNIYTNKKINSKTSNAYFSFVEEPFKKLRTRVEVKQELIQLNSNFQMFIITSNKESLINPYLLTNNLEVLFKEVLGKETHHSKIEKFSFLFKKYNLLKEDCIFITDTLGDILEANKVGLKTIAVDFGFHERERLEKGNPFKIVSHFNEILPLIKDL